ncbi:MAG: MATE family efflux transporter, partial [Eubacteriaceae bacterium]
VYITVIGRCMGSGDTGAAEYYMDRLTRITYAISIAWNGLILALTPVILQFYSLSPETKQLVFILVVIHNIFNAFVYPITGPFANGLRAAGDVKFTMLTTLFTTIVVRLLLSLLFAITFNMGVIGIAWAMVADWTIRALILGVRYKSDKWKAFQII